MHLVDANDGDIRRRQDNATPKLNKSLRTYIVIFDGENDKPVRILH